MNSITPLVADDAVTVRLLAIESDPGKLRAVVQQVLPHCDQLHVHVLNTELPELRDTWTGHDDVSVFRHPPNSGTTIADGYCIQVCDAYSYPSGYIASMVQSIEQHKRKAIVGLAGSLILRPDAAWYTAATQSLPSDTPVHILGAHTLAYHAGTLQVTGYQDVSVALWAQRHKVPAVMVKRGKSWVTHRALSSEAVSIITDHEHRFNWQLYACEG